MTRSPLGKYRDLVIAIALFLVLDLGVLLFNFFASQELELDATRINRAGELRMLTQQMTKALLTFQIEKRDGLPTQTSHAQLSEAYGSFNTALAYLEAQERTERGAMAKLFASADAHDHVVSLKREWGPLGDAIRPVLAKPDPEAFDVENAANKAVARNIKMANLADDLAGAVEKTALDKAQRMRQIQVGGILLALLNFVFIVMKFVRSLRMSDRLAEAARQDTEDILANVKEGLLLVHRDGTVSGQASASLARMFGRPLAAGENFRRLIASVVPAESREALDDYLDLLFKPDIKAGLLESLNPLHETPVRPHGRPQGPPLYLTFQFSQIRDAKGVDELLVTVFDVTEKVLLERELAEHRERSKNEMEDVLSVLDKDVDLVDTFLAEARVKLEVVNVSLQSVQPKREAYQALVNATFATLHGIKGEAATLGIGSVTRQAHAFEDVLARLRTRESLTGEDLIPVAVEVSKIEEALDRVHRVVERVKRFSRPQALANPLEQLVGPLADLAKRVSADVGKRVRFEAYVPYVGEVPAALATMLREAVPQLVRNAIVHGIETPEVRARAGKDPEGLLRLEISRRDDGTYAVSLRDDGRGIVLDEIRERLLVTGKLAAQDVASMTDMQVLSTLFDPGFTSAERVTEHAGRGVGLALVRDLVARVGAKLRVSTTPRVYTQFTFQM